MYANPRKLMVGFLFSLSMFSLSVAVLADNRLPSTDGPGGLPANVRPPQLEGVGIDEHLGRPIDLSLTFIAENGYPVALSQYFHQGRPVILNLVYYNCPMLC